MPLTVTGREPVPAAPPAGNGVLGLVAELGTALTAYGIPACQWKGHWKPERWGTGDGDIDLLVAPDAAADLSWLLRRLGFKEGVAPEGIPGMASYYGLDRPSGRLIHVHVHHRLLIGRMWATYYHIAIERVVLTSARRNGVFRTPSPELELLLLTLDQTLRRTPLEILVGRGAARAAAAWPAARRLRDQSSRVTLERLVAEHLPTVDMATIDRAIAALQPGASHWRAYRAARALRRGLEPYAARRASSNLRRPFTNGSRKYSATGGRAIGLDGADGAGKSTAAAALREWLDPAFETMHAHFGRAPRSLATLAAGLTLKLAQLAADGRVIGHLELLRCLATARDRFLLYRRVRGFVARGGIAICERYPNSGNRMLAGPSTAQGVAPDLDTALARRLRRIEARYYEQIGAPDLLLVMLVDPETAVRRKTTEPEAYVRARAQAMARSEWDGSRSRLVDATRPFPEVLAELKARVWESL